MASDDHNETFDNVEAQSGFTDPAGVTHSGELADAADVGSTGLEVENQNGTTLLATTAIHAGSNLGFVDDGDGTVTLNATDSNTHVNVQNTLGTDFVKNVQAIHAGDNLDFVDDGNNVVTLNATASGGSGDAQTASDVVTVSGTGSQTTFTLEHTLGTTPEAASVTPASDGASTDYYIDGLTSSSVNITFARAPASGTDNLSFHVLTHTSTAGATTAATTATKSGTGTQTTFGLPNPLDVAPTATSIEPASDDASTDFRITNTTSTGIEITYARAPSSGTDNLSYQIIAHE